MFIDDKQKEYMNRVREEYGYRTLDEISELSKTNTIFDICSLLISKTVVLGGGNIIYPNVVIKGQVIIGDSNVLHSGTNIQGINGSIDIGSNNEIGENNACIKALNGTISIKNNCRIINNAQVLDGCYIGNGCQVLGSVKIANCYLCDGGSYKEKNPNERGGVIKGYGIGNKLTVEKGYVINGSGEMMITMIEKQENYHSNWKNEEPK